MHAQRRDGGQRRAPERLCPADVSETCSGPSGATATFGAATADDCNTITWSQTHTSGQLFPIGTTPVTFTANDGNGQSTPCTFNVNIGAGPPVWTQNCPADMLITSFTTGPSGSTTVSWTAPLANDGCGSSLAVSQIGGPANGSSFNVVTQSTSTITYQTAADPVTGQQISCSFEVSFGFASLSRVDQLAETDVGTLIMYIPFTVVVEYVNIPVQTGVGRLWLSDGTTTMNMPMKSTGGDTFDTAQLTNQFLGPHTLLPGPITMWATVDSDPFYFGNQMAMELVIQW